MTVYEKFCTLAANLSAGMLCEELYSYFGESAMSDAVDDIANEWGIEVDKE